MMTDVPPRRKPTPSEFQALAPEERAAFFNEDGIHLNEAGSTRIAEIMYDHFVRHELLAP
jgi:lysophospholipase L1-like esterase